MRIPLVDESILETGEGLQSSNEERRIGKREYLIHSSGHGEYTRIGRITRCGWNAIAQSRGKVAAANIRNTGWILCSRTEARRNFRAAI